MTQQLGSAAYRLNALLDRIRAFEQIVGEQQVGGGGASPGRRRALQHFVDYASMLKRELEDSYSSAPDDTIRLASLRNWNDHLKARVEFFDELFRRGDRRVPSPLLDIIERDVLAMCEQSTQAVVTIGRPDNFLTFTADLRSTLLNGLSLRSLSAEVDAQPKLVVIAAPESEGARATWLPITCGHELAHYLQRVRPVKRTHNNELDTERVGALVDAPPGASNQPISRVLEQIAANWLEELTCDAYAVHRFGAAAVVALSDFLSYVSPTSVATTSHPPRALRTKLMLTWLERGKGGDELGIAAPVSDSAMQDPPLPSWAQLLADHFTALADSIWADVHVWTAQTPYVQAEAAERIRNCATKLRAGVPPVEFTADGSQRRFSPADIVNAAWLVFLEAPETPVNQLALKALDILDFMQRWLDAGGSLGEHPTEEIPDDIGARAAQGALSAAEIRSRLASEGKQRLSVIPRLPPEVTDASVDLRLGNQFIVFEKSNLGQFDALDPLQDPRAIQARVDKPWGDVFYLHPGQLVLAATLEYLVMPNDLVGQVITRSSYGRLGLLSATAVQVHPGYAGCLTLELVNLGELPMAITPGERVAQLMLWHAQGFEESPARDQGPKYRHPVGPEFSKIRDDKESRVLIELRRRYATERELS